MAKQIQAEAKHKYDERVETHISGIVVDNEYQTSKSNKNMENAEFESFVSLFESEGTDREYEWMSDISLPEFPSHMLTQSSIDVAQYFQTRDFTEVYLEDESDEALKNAAAAKECINRTLNQRHLYHYQKYVRSKLINHLQGNVYIECRWEQKLKSTVVGHEQRVEELDVDEYGNSLIDLDYQTPARRIVEEPVMGDVPVVDRFNYDVYDPRNVFTDNKYVYSLQEKDYVIFRSERSLEELRADAEDAGYFNLDVLAEMKTDGNTETATETRDRDEGKARPDKTPNKPYDILRRYGKFWCTVTDRDEDGEPSDVEPGLDVNGEPLEDSELLEVVITHALTGSSKVLIGFHLQPYMDTEGTPYRPIFRGLCYIHPTSDNGIGDGKYSREIQAAIDDTFNISNDRVMLATMPTLKTKKYSSEDNDTIYFEPGHSMELENPEDVVEFKMDDNIVGALNQIGMLTSKMQQVTSIYPTTMGQTPEHASTTATAVAGAESRTDMRTNYKSMTFENTALTDMYWMIMQMTYQFAKPETGVKLMGDKVYDFNPQKDFYYKPVSASIESEQAKQVKVQRWTQVLGYIAQLGHPDAAKLTNYILSQIFKYMGDEYANFGDKLLDPKIPIDQGGGGGAEQVGAGGPATSNQYGMQQSATEQGAREGFSEN